MTATSSLVELIELRLQSGNVELPVFDDIALRVHREVRQNKLDTAGMCEILETDPVLVSEILRMANSSFYAGLTSVKNLQDAAVRLGITQIATIVVSVKSKKMYSATSSHFRNRLERLWAHSSAVAQTSRWLAKSAGYADLADDAFVAGLLHDVGKLSLLCIIEDIIIADEMVLSDAIVNLTINQLHPGHGAKLLESWNLPETFRDVVLHQSDQTFDEANILLCIVRLVDRACVLEDISDMPGNPTLDLETLPETSALGLSNIDLAELRLVLEDCRAELKVAA